MHNAVIVIANIALVLMIKISSSVRIVVRFELVVLAIVLRQTKKLVVREVFIR